MLKLHNGVKHMIRSMILMAGMILLAAVFGFIGGYVASLVMGGAAPFFTGLLCWFLCLVWMGGLTIGCLRESVAKEFA